MSATNKPLRLKANITKVVRINGKAEAQMVVMIPVSASAEIPMGEVLLAIEPTQKSML